jgi:hypothetical protein
MQRLEVSCEVRHVCVYMSLGGKELWNKSLKMPVRSGFPSNRALPEYQPVASPLYTSRSINKHVFMAWICDLHHTSTTYLALQCRELIHFKALSNNVKADTFHVLFLFELWGYKWLCRLNPQHRAPCVRGSFIGRVVLRVGYVCLWAIGAIEQYDSPRLL